MGNVMRTAASYTWRSFTTVLLGIAGRMPKLEFLVYEITDACNSRCAHCNIWETKASKDMLNTDEIKEVFSRGDFKDVKELIITGGEPVLRHDILECLLAIRQYVSPHAIFSFSTNALMPERVLEVVNGCLGEGMRLVVGVSLDGIGDEHDRVRGVEGNFKKVIYLLEELLAMKKKNNLDDRLSVTVGYTFSRKTCDSMRDVRSYVQSLGLRFLPQAYEEFSYYSNTSGTKEKFWDEGLIKAIEELSPSFQKEVLLKIARKDEISFRCSSLKNFLLLRCNGDVTPCLRYSHIKIGNLRDQSFQEIWTGEKAKEARSTIHDCKGCSNTWATGWSLRYWMPPFFRILSEVVIKKQLARIRNIGGEKACS